MDVNVVAVDHVFDTGNLFLYLVFAQMRDRLILENMKKLAQNDRGFHGS